MTKIISLDDITKGRDERSLELINTLLIAGVSVHGDELEYVLVEDNEWNRVILVDAGMPEDLIDLYFAAEDDGFIEISEFAFMKGASYFKDATFY